MVKTEIREFTGSFIWKIHRFTDHWANVEVIKSPIIEFTDSESDMKLSCQAMVESWKEFKVVGENITTFNISEINEDEKYQIHDISKAMEWDWRYRNEINLHVEVKFNYCIHI